jgi:endonuclease/exonuclease/phosphatase (EEP) superfamily protein YafD
MTFPDLTLSRLAGAGVAVLLCAPLGIGLAALSGIAHRWPDILAQFTGPALIGALALTATAAVLRQWPVTAFGGLACLLLLAAGWPQWSPPTGKAQAGAPVVTLYSANLHYRNRDLPRIAASIAESRPDVVVLIESSWTIMHGMDAALPDLPYRVVQTGVAYGADGTVIASRWPVRMIEARSGSNHVAAVVQTPLGDVTVFAVHLTRPWPYQIEWEQVRQIEVLDASAKGVTGPMLLAGDFNSVSSARIGRTIQRDLGVVPAPGWPGTWPSSLPSFAGMTIDQVYRTPDLAVLDRRLGRPNGSDHRPVVTRLTSAETRSRP